MLKGKVLEAFTRNQGSESDPGDTKTGEDAEAGKGWGSSCGASLEAVSEEASACSCGASLEAAPDAAWGRHNHDGGKLPTVETPCASLEAAPDETRGCSWGISGGSSKPTVGAPSKDRAATLEAA